MGIHRDLRGFVEFHDQGFVKIREDAWRFQDRTCRYARNRMNKCIVRIKFSGH